jgi:hypothetical protein
LNLQGIEIDMMTWPGQDMEDAGDKIKAGANAGVIKTKDLGTGYDKEKLKCQKGALDISMFTTYLYKIKQKTQFSKVDQIRQLIVPLKPENKSSTQVTTTRIEQYNKINPTLRVCKLVHLDLLLSPSLNPTIKHRKQHFTKMAKN